MRLRLEREIGTRITQIGGMLLALLLMSPVARGEGTVALNGNHPDAVSRIA